MSSEAHASGKPSREQQVQAWCKQNPEAYEALNDYVEYWFKDIALSAMSEEEIFESALKGIKYEPLPKGIGPRLFFKYW